MKVNIFGIGSPKCGTTTLFQLLSNSSHCCTSIPKETHFFNDDKRYAKGVDWYECKYFDHYKNEPFIADVTPSYSWDQPQLTAERIYNYNPFAKIVLLVRDPLQRLISEWKMCYASLCKGYSSAPHNTSAALGFQSWIAANGGLRACLRSSLYGTAVNAYINWFPHSAIHIASQELFSTNYNNTVIDILDFLDIPIENHLLAPIRANSASQTYGILSSVASFRSLSILPSPIEKKIRYCLRNRWLQRPLRYPSLNIDPYLRAQIYGIVRDDCANSAISLVGHMSLWGH